MNKDKIVPSFVVAIKPSSDLKNLPVESWEKVLAVDYDKTHYANAITGSLISKSTCEKLQTT